MTTPTVLHGKEHLMVNAPGEPVVLCPPHVPPLPDPADAIRRALAQPIASEPLASLVHRVPADGRVVVVVSDITRPVPNDVILPPILATLEENGVAADRVTILIATGMHRPSTEAERNELVGLDIARKHRIVDHRSDDKSTLIALPRRTGSGTQVWVNRLYMEASLRIVTGFIEPHFMAGFSGGRKSICPGLVNLETVQKFHGPGFLENPCAEAGTLPGNPCHREALDVARMAGIDFLVNVTVDIRKRITGVFAGHFEEAHAAGVAANREQVAVDVEREYDIVVSCGGGYPLDTTLYQTIKGMVLATPFVKPEGILVLAASCSEGIGSEEYRSILFEWSGRWGEFIDEIKRRDYVQRDQWEFEMHVRTLRKIGEHGIHLVTEGLDEPTLQKCSVTPAEGCGRDPAQKVLDRLLKKLARENPDAEWAVIPTGPYILPRVPALAGA